MRRFLLRIARDRRGATAVEYGMILALVFLAIVGAVSTLSNENQKVWNSVSDRSSEAVASSKSASDGA